MAEQPKTPFVALAVAASGAIAIAFLVLSSGDRSVDEAREPSGTSLLSARPTVVFDEPSFPSIADPTDRTELDGGLEGPPSTADQPTTDSIQADAEASFSIETEFTVDGIPLDELELTSLDARQVESLLLEVQRRGGRELRTLLAEHEAYLRSSTVTDEEYAVAQEFGADRFFVELPGTQGQIAEATALVSDRTRALRRLTLDLLGQAAFGEQRKARLTALCEGSAASIDSPPVLEALGSRLVQYDNSGKRVGMMMSTLFGFP